MIASLSRKTGIAPNALLESPPEVLVALIRQEIHAAEEADRAQLRADLEGRVR